MKDFYSPQTTKLRHFDYNINNTPVNIKEIKQRHLLSTDKLKIQLKKANLFPDSLKDKAILNLKELKIKRSKLLHPEENISKLNSINNSSRSQCMLESLIVSSKNTHNAQNIQSNQNNQNNPNNNMIINRKSNNFNSQNYDSYKKAKDQLRVSKSPPYKILSNENIFSSATRKDVAAFKLEKKLIHIKDKLKRNEINERKFTRNYSMKLPLTESYKENDINTNNNNNFLTKRDNQYDNRAKCELKLFSSTNSEFPNIIQTTNTQTQVSQLNNQITTTNSGFNNTNTNTNDNQNNFVNNNSNNGTVSKHSKSEKALRINKSVHDSISPKNLFLPPLQARKSLFCNNSLTTENLRQTLKPRKSMINHEHKHKFKLSLNSNANNNLFNSLDKKNKATETLRKLSPKVAFNLATNIKSRANSKDNYFNNTSNKVNNNYYYYKHANQRYSSNKNSKLNFSKDQKVDNTNTNNNDDNQNKKRNEPNKMNNTDENKQVYKNTNKEKDKEMKVEKFIVVENNCETKREYSNDKNKNKLTGEKNKKKSIFFCCF